MAVAKAGQRKPTKRPHPERIERLAALASLHDQWVADTAETAGFDPAGRPKKSDYNIHHVDLEATPEAGDDFTRKASKIFKEPGPRGGG